eukprot:CAMPEP_0114250522 /NCGR_PEP_ID=MMETSP0058-20121206/14745_1 /TAXON_ID=36894 /ORGANISM="Pyramimonas parkeae, CCMP726" /LENGTH=338 /DNA_ID=CAMNT_0001364189 /DNA_START=252 /DNA_END=1268 /DNA_ORIENTATION=+
MNIRKSSFSLKDHTVAVYGSPLCCSNSVPSLGVPAVVLRRPRTHVTGRPQMSKGYLGNCARILGYISAPRKPRLRRSVICVAHALDVCHGFSAVVNSEFVTHTLYAIRQSWTLHPMITDGMTAASLYFISDLIAQRQQQRPSGKHKSREFSANLVADNLPLQDADTSRWYHNHIWLHTKSVAAAINWGRVRRYASFGVIDGSCSHVWFNMLDQAIPDTTVLAVVEKIIVDFLVFTPGWCAVFLVYMALSEGAGRDGAARRLARDWFDLYKGNVCAWLPLNAIIYGLVPLEQRVLAFAGFSLVYSVVLSRWAEQTSGMLVEGVHSTEESTEKEDAEVLC